MQEIALGGAKGRGKAVLVDDKDFVRLRAWKWHLNGGYAEHSIFVGKGRTPKMVKLHHLLLGQRVGFVVDHRNGNTLDNRRQNLRFVTRSQNKMNSVKKQAGASSRFKGISKRFGKYWPRIQVDGHRTHIGGFVNERHAALAYELWAVDLFGEYARPTFNIVLHSQRKKPAA